MLLDTKSKDAQFRPLSARGLLLLDTPKSRPNSSSSCTFGHPPTSYRSGHKHSLQFNDRPTSGIGSGGRPLSATPSMLAGGQR